MKRDWDCIRSILVALEEKGDASSHVRSGDLSGFDPETGAYHMKLMIEAGLIEGDCSKGRAPFCVAQSMTWEGHELLDKIRSDKVWNSVKSTAREQGQSLSFDLIKFLARRAVEALFM